MELSFLAKLLALPLIVLITAALLSLSLSGSGWSFSSSDIGSESSDSISGISVASVGGPDNGITSCTAIDGSKSEVTGITSCTTTNTPIEEKEKEKKCDNSGRFELKENMIQGWGCIRGTNDKDFIQAIPDPGTGTGLDNIIFGKDKPDIIFSDVGIDTVYGGAGGDTIQGGAGNDQLFGKGGDDHIFGGSDDDLVVGGRGNNHLFGDTGNDVLKGGENSGANYFDCGDGLDVIIDFNPKRGDVTAGNCEIF